MTDTVVVKVGGSLLGEPGAMAEVARWLDATRCEGQRRVLVAGGGAAVEALREVDRANPLVAAASHWAAIEIMDAHAGLLADWFPGTAPVDEIPSLPGDYALRPGRWLREVEPLVPGERLAMGWQTTSDAIAARVAAALGSPLVLLKHTMVKAYDSLAAAAADGLVDPEAPRIGKALREVRVLGAIWPGLGRG